MGGISFGDDWKPSGDALGKAFTGKSEESQGKTYGKWTRDAIKNMGGAGRGGGVRKLADKLGVSPSTVRRWAKSNVRGDKGISAEHKENLKRVQRESRLDPKSVEAFRNAVGRRRADSGSGDGGGGSGVSSGSLVVTGVFTKSQDTRERTVYLGHHLPANAADRIIQAYIDGGPEGAKDMLNALVSQHYVSGMSVDAISDIGW